MLMPPEENGGNIQEAGPESFPDASQGVLCVGLIGVSAFLCSSFEEQSLKSRKEGEAESSFLVAQSIVISVG
jgi:hypothetical protein